MPLAWPTPKDFGLSVRYFLTTTTFTFTKALDMHLWEEFGQEIINIVWRELLSGLSVLGERESYDYVIHIATVFFCLCLHVFRSRSMREACGSSYFCSAHGC